MDHVGNLNLDEMTGFVLKLTQSHWSGFHLGEVMILPLEELFIWGVLSRLEANSRPPDLPTDQQPVFHLPTPSPPHSSPNRQLLADSQVEAHLSMIVML